MYNETLNLFDIFLHYKARFGTPWDPIFDRFGKTKRGDYTPNWVQQDYDTTPPQTIPNWLLSGWLPKRDLKKLYEARNEQCLKCFLAFARLSYCVFMVHYWFGMANQCLGMVSDIDFYILETFKCWPNIGPWIPYLLQKYSKTHKNKSIFSRFELHRLAKIIDVLKWFAFSSNVF